MGFSVASLGSHYGGGDTGPQTDAWISSPVQILENRFSGNMVIVKLMGIYYVIKPLFSWV